MHRVQREAQLSAVHVPPAKVLEATITLMARSLINPDKVSAIYLFHPPTPKWGGHFSKFLTLDTGPSHPEYKQVARKPFPSGDS
jgi:hypothetical protein